MKELKYIRRTVYLRPKQYRKLLKLRNSIYDEHGVNIPMAELFRDSLDEFMGKIENYGINSYLEFKGW